MKPVASLLVLIRPSRRLQLIQSLAHVVAAAAVLSSIIPPWLAVTLLLLVGASLARLRRPSPVAGLLLRGDGGLETLCAGGDPKGVQNTTSEVMVHPHTLVLSFIVVLLYRQEGRLRSLVLLADSLEPEDFRQLRLWLRWRSTATHPT
jgi:toxin CptA